MTSNTGVAISKNVVLIIVTTVSFIMPFLVASVSVALPTMGREFNMDAVMISWVSTVYFLTTAMIQVPCGRLADIYGRKKLLLLGLVISVFSSFSLLSKIIGGRVFDTSSAELGALRALRSFGSLRTLSSLQMMVSAL